MSVVTINLRDIFDIAVSCEVIFSPQNTPFAGSDRALYISGNRSVRTAADGTGSVTLAPGTYKVTLAGTVIGASRNEVTIGVPDDDQTYPMSILITEGATPPVPPVYQGEPGSKILSGARDPLPEDGADSDYWLNSATRLLFGPKAGGEWPSVGIPLKGDPGREVELQKSATHIQWRLVGDSAWINLVALADLKGGKGEKGDPGTAATIEVGDVETVPYDTLASVDNTGTEQAAVLDFKIPQGPPGPLNEFDHVELTGTDMDCSRDTFFYKTISADTAFTLSNLSNGRVVSLSLTAVGDAQPLWPVAIKWPGGITPLHPADTLGEYQIKQVNGTITGAAIYY